ncbi:hypothetical protein [Streptomyces sp. CFMR 7]|uniref:hypothetical protein n=1 Tax=Streptomyces sp. CFMR 7 TaxID=1649184 RepID=UPI00131BE76C|nr:hypothetical protein [Streptomyces sp. CFMR 7]
MPTVGLNYSAQRIGGRITAINNQSSRIGDGFECASGFSEHRSKPCAEDGQKNGDGSTPGDLGRGYDNVFLTFNGDTSQLVPTGTNSFKLKSDDGTKMDRLHKHRAGQGRQRQRVLAAGLSGRTPFTTSAATGPLAGRGQDETNLSWTGPAFGNHTSEPRKKMTVAESWCQTWRWNSDAVVDSRQPDGVLLRRQEDQLLCANP